MSRVSELEARLSRLKNQKKNTESSRKSYKARREDLEKIIKKLVDVTDDSYGDINRFVRGISEDLRSSIKGSRFADNLEGAVNDSKESSSSSDKNISEALSNLRAELQKVKSKIEGYDNDIASLRRQINNTESELWEARKAEAAEALKDVFT